MCRVRFAGEEELSRAMQGRSCFWTAVVASTCQSTCQVRQLTENPPGKELE